MMKNARFTLCTVAITLSGLLLTPHAAFPAESVTSTHSHELPADNRQVLPFDAREKNFLLTEMREFLVVTQRILAANAAGDMKTVADAARSVGLKAHKNDLSNPDSIVHNIRKKAPLAFFPQGKATHEGFDEIADIASEIGDKDTVNKMLASNLQRCIACHATYRVGDGH